MDFTTGSVVDSATGETATGYAGSVDEGDHTVCGLGIISISLDKDVGQWSCLMNEDAQNYYQKGTFQVVAWHLFFQTDCFIRKLRFQVLASTEAFVTDVRLPRHLAPIAYYMDLIPFLEGERESEVDGFARMVIK